MRLTRTVLMSLMLLAALPAAAAEAARDQLNRFSEDVQNLSAKFVQEVYDDAGNAIDSASGNLALARPNRFRWDYLEPEEQRIVADGDNIWIYDVELEQVTVRPQSFDEQQSPLAVLLDLGSLDEQFATEDRGEADGSVWLRLKPRSKDAEFSRVDLGLRGHELVRMVMVDIVGQRTEIVFSDWKRNTTLAPATFHFEPPPGVDVVGDVKPGAMVMPLGD
jgi:outer membrane lipoprotein carrier protein